jgi:hypothetical protein
MDATIEKLRIAAGDNRRDRGPAESLERPLIDLPMNAHISAARTGAGAGGKR